MGKLCFVLFCAIVLATSSTFCIKAQNQELPRVTVLSMGEPGAIENQKNSRFQIEFQLKDTSLIESLEVTGIFYNNDYFAWSQIFPVIKNGNHYVILSDGQNEITDNIAKLEISLDAQLFFQLESLKIVLRKKDKSTSDPIIIPLKK